MHYADQYAAAVIEYARSDQRRLYPGHDHFTSFDDPRLGELLHEYHTNSTESNHAALLSHLADTQPVARHLIDYMQQVGGPTRKPKTIATVARGRRNPVTLDHEDDRGELQLYHHAELEKGQVGSRAMKNATINLSVAHPHAGNVYVYHMSVPNFHPEQVAPTRSPAQRRVSERLGESSRRRG